MPVHSMNKRNLVLAALAPAKGEPYSSVQVQKLFFLLDAQGAHLVNGPHFDFQPYHYGPFDKAVYKELDALAAEGLADVRRRSYALTAAGQAEGEMMLAELPAATREYLSKLSAFVRRLNFSELVSAIYKAYPAMRVNSVFQG